MLSNYHGDNEMIIAGFFLFVLKLLTENLCMSVYVYGWEHRGPAVEVSGSF